MIPTRDANVPAWQVKVANEFNRMAPSIRSASIGILPMTDNSAPPQLITDSAGNLMWTYQYAD